MQLGYMTAILPDADLEETLRVAAEIGYDCVEVMCWPPGKASRRYAGVTHIDVLSLDGAKIDRIRALQDETGVTISGLGYYPNALSPDAEEAETAVEQIRAVIEATARLGFGI